MHTIQETRSARKPTERREIDNTIISSVILHNKGAITQISQTAIQQIYYAFQ